MSNTIQRIIEIPLQEVQSPNYYANLEKYGEDSNTCCICGKRIKNMEKTKYVHMLTSGNIVSHGGDDIEDSQGLFPVGNDCAKKLIISFIF
jgi:hypothetical protein